MVKVRKKSGLTIASETAASASGFPSMVTPDTVMA
jgi:hypothetical protein